MLKFLKYNKTKRKVFRFFNEYESVDQIKIKPKRVLEIKFSSISKKNLISLSSKFINTLGGDIEDLEIVFNENPELQITNSILVSLEKKLISSLDLNQTNADYKNFNEHGVSKKHSKIYKNELGNLIFSSNIGTYYIYKMKQL